MTMIHPGKRLFVYSSICAALLALAGCGGSSGSDNNAGSASAVKQTTTPAALTVKAADENGIPFSLDLSDLSDLSVKADAKATKPSVVCEAGKEPAFDHVFIKVAKNTLVKTLNIPVGCGNIANGRLEGLEKGNWKIAAAVYDASNNKVFSARSAVYILPGKVFTVDLPFTVDNSSGTGGVIFNVSINSALQQELSWLPAPTLIPKTGNYVYLSSTAGDYIGAGKNYLYKNDEFSLSSSKAALQINVDEVNNTDWDAGFALPNTLDTLQAGTYTGLTRLPFSSTKTGGFEWTGNGRGCNQSTSWVVIDQATYEAGALKSVDFRFAQHCESDPNNALFGAVHWVSSSPNVGTNWQPDPKAIPSAGSYIYLQSDKGDYVGQGQTYLFTPSGANIAVTANKNVLDVAVNTDTWWNANFAIPDSNKILVKGLYTGLTRYPFHNTKVGGLDWSGDGRGCNQETGWVAIDDVTYKSGVLQSIDLRFEQHCEGGAPALRGKIHWVK